MFKLDSLGKKIGNETGYKSRQQALDYVSDTYSRPLKFRLLEVNDDGKVESLEHLTFDGDSNFRETYSTTE